MQRKELRHCVDSFGNCCNSDQYFLAARTQLLGPGSLQVVVRGKEWNPQ
jgi:hypothetical protein